MEDVGIFYGHVVHFTVYCYILWTFGIVRGNLVYFSHFGILYEEKSGNPGCASACHSRVARSWISAKEISPKQLGCQSGLPDFTWPKHTQNGKYITHCHKLYQITVKYTKLM
jgi:hypothetical protein